MRHVLILAREEVVAALLGLMVELIDCDHPDCTDALIDTIRRLDATPILFSPFRMQSEVRAVAARHRVRAFTLPTDPGTFGKMFDA